MLLPSSVSRSLCSTSSSATLPLNTTHTFFPLVLHSPTHQADLPPTITHLQTTGWALHFAFASYRIIERFGLEGNSKGHLVQPPAMSRYIFSQTRLLRAPANLTLNVSRDGASPTSLGNLFQGFTTLIINNLFLMSSLHLPSSSLKPLPLVLSLQALLKSLAPSFLQAPFRYWKAAIRSPHSLLFSRLNSSRSLSLFSQPRCSSPHIFVVALLPIKPRRKWLNLEADSILESPVSWLHSSSNHFCPLLQVFSCLDLQLFEYCTWLGCSKPPALANRLSGASDLLGRDVLDFTGDTWQQEKKTNVLCETWKHIWAVAWNHVASMGQHFAESLGLYYQASKMVHAHSQNNWTFLMASSATPTLVCTNNRWLLCSGPWQLYWKWPNQQTPNI